MAYNILAIYSKNKLVAKMGTVVGEGEEERGGGGGGIRHE